MKVSTMRSSVLDPALDALTGEVLDAAMAVHRQTGPGLLESYYRNCLRIELTRRGHRVELEVPVQATYDREPAGLAFRMDMLVDGVLIVEVKAVEQAHPVHTAQLLTYLKVTGLRAGLLLNFHARLLREGIRRVVNTPPEPSPYLRGTLKQTRENTSPDPSSSSSLRASEDRPEGESPRET